MLGWVCWGEGVWVWRWEGGVCWGEGYGERKERCAGVGVGGGERVVLDVVKMCGCGGGREGCAGVKVEGRIEVCAGVR